MHLQALGVTPFVVDVFDAGGLTQTVAVARPDIVIHQLTPHDQKISIHGDTAVVTSHVPRICAARSCIFLSPQ